jgi:hypothetical protein
MKAWIQKHPSPSNILHLCLLAGLLLSACTPLAQPLENASSPPGGSAAPSATPAATLPASELPPVTQSPLETVTFSEFGRTFSLAFDPALAQSVEPMTVEAVPANQDVMFSDTHPAFVQFTFLGYDQGRHDQLPSASRVPRLMAFPTQDFKGFGPDEPTGFPQQLEDLRNLLETRPDLAERCTQVRPVPGELALPFLPWLNEAQVFCAKPQYIEFSDGKGIRYLTAFSQGVAPLVDPGIFYTFQGLSEDGEIYFSGTFPVLTGIFPLEIHPGVDGQQPQNMTPEQLNALNAQSEDLFQPALGQLDALLKSMKVEK